MIAGTSGVSPVADGDRLSVADASFVYAETSTAPLHVGMLGVFEDRGATLERLRAHVASRVHLFARLRHKLVFVPYDQGHPVWADDEHFDVCSHVRAASLDGLADDARARRYTAEVMGAPLQRDRPLWEMRLLQMTGDRIGLIFKIHHCLLDGMSAAHLVTVLFDGKRDAPARATEAWTPKAEPTPDALLRDAVQDQLLRVAQLRDKAAEWTASDEPRELLGRATEIAGSVVEWAKATLLTHRRASLTQWVGPYRRFETASVALADVKQIKGSAGCKLNDVALAMVAGGVGRMLRRRGVATAGANVKAMVPVSTRDAAHKTSYGNLASVMAVDLPVGALSASTRLQQISEQMTRLKSSRQWEGMDFWVGLAEHIPPAVVSLVSKVGRLQRVVDVIVTNVPGPPFPLYLLGGEMLEIYPYVPLIGATSLGIAVVSYNGRLYFGLSGDRDAMPDLAEVSRGISTAFEELRATVARPAQESAA